MCACVRVCVGVGVCVWVGVQVRVCPHGIFVFFLVTGCISLSSHICTCMHASVCLRPHGRARVRTNMCVCVRVSM